MLGTITRKQVEESLKGFNDWKKPKENNLYMAYDGKKVKFFAYNNEDREAIAKNSSQMKELERKDMLVLTPKDMDFIYQNAWKRTNYNLFGKKNTKEKNPTKPIWLDALFIKVTELNEDYKEEQKNKKARGSLTPEADKVVEEFLDTWQEFYKQYLLHQADAWKESKDKYLNHPIMVERYPRSYQRTSHFNYSGAIYELEIWDSGREYLREVSKVSKSELEVIQTYLIYRDEDTSKANEVLSEYIKLRRRLEKTKLVENLEQYGKVLKIDSMRIGVDGKLNGLIITEKGTVSVVSFYASGFVQSLHIRHKATLLKDKK